MVCVDALNKSARRVAVGSLVGAKFSPWLRRRVHREYYLVKSARSTTTIRIRIKSNVNDSEALQHQRPGG
jgi:hypothetical protein